MSQDETMTAVLTLAATPIGDPQDASARLREFLANADLIAAEDTRRTRRLAHDLGISMSGRLVAVHDHNESARAQELVEAALAGQRVLMVTDAGMPSVSDPGYAVVRACIDAQVRVTLIPGPSAALMALTLSGLPTDRFCFEGFLSRKAGERLRMLEHLKAEPRTMIFFEAPHRLADLLQAMVEVFGQDREAVVCRELTKTYEEVRRGSLAEHAHWAQGEVLGEITVVVAGATAERPSDAALVAEVLARVAAGERMKDAAKEVALTVGLPSKELYAQALAARSAT